MIPYRAGEISDGVNAPCARMMCEPLTAETIRGFCVSVEKDLGFLEGLPGAFQGVTVHRTS
jgi:hypothetical protein